MFGFVPESICRIQSIWKNYLEFGNIHAFKPHVYLKNQSLRFEKNYLKKKTQIKNLDLIIKKIEKKDRFYKEKFKKRVFKFPYFLSFLKNVEINIKIFLLTFKYIFKKKINIDELDNKFFPIVMSKNIDESHNLYKEEYSKELIPKTMLEISKNVSSKKEGSFLLFSSII